MTKSIGERESIYCRRWMLALNPPIWRRHASEGGYILGLTNHQARRRVPLQEYIPECDIKDSADAFVSPSRRVAEEIVAEETVAGPASGRRTNEVGKTPMYARRDVGTWLT
jgi:hypothetical protein